MDVETSTPVAVKYPGFQVLVDTWRAVPSAASSSRDRSLLLLSMYGPRNSVRSIWASAVRGSGLKIVGPDGTSYSGGFVVTENHRPRHASAPIRQEGFRDMEHFVIYDQRAEADVSRRGDDEVVTVGPDRHSRAAQILRRRVTVPLRKEWFPELLTKHAPEYEKRSDGERVSYEAAGFGVPVLIVSANSARWSRLVTTLLKEGVLQ